MVNQPPTPGAVATTLNTSASQLLTLENGFPAAPAQTTNGLVTNTVAVDPRYKIGYAQIWNLSLEHQFGNQYVVELLYTGTKGTHLDLVFDPNQATPGSQIGSDQRRRIANAQDFTYETSGGDSIYNGLQVRVQRRMSNGLRMLFLYTLGHSIDDASVVGAGHISGLVQDYNNLAAERGNSFFDVRHDIRSTFGYDLPFGDRRHWLRSGAGAKLFGNWELIGTTQYSSGSHLTPYISASFTNSVGPLLSQRPDQIGDPNLPGSQQTHDAFFQRRRVSIARGRNFRQCFARHDRRAFPVQREPGAGTPHALRAGRKIYVPTSLGDDESHQRAQLFQRDHRNRCSGRRAPHRS